MKMGATNYLYKVPTNGLRIDGGYLRVAIEYGLYWWQGIYRTEYDKGHFTDNSDDTFLHRKKRVRFFNIFREGADYYLYAAIEGQVTKTNLTTEETKTFANFKDRIVTSIYEAGDYVYLVTPKGIVPMRKDSTNIPQPETYIETLKNIIALHDINNEIYTVTDVAVFKTAKDSFLNHGSSDLAPSDKEL